MRATRSLIAQLAAEHRDARATEMGAFVDQPNADDAAARGRLITGELGLVESSRPERRECTMRGTGHGIFIHARLRGEEAREEVVTRIVGRRCDHQPARVDSLYLAEVRRQ